jgi:hypothetical protein
MLACTYYGALSDPSITEYLPLLHDGYAGEAAMRKLAQIARSANVNMQALPSADDDAKGLEMLADALTSGQAPQVVAYKMDGKFVRVLQRKWI